MRSVVTEVKRSFGWRGLQRKSGSFAAALKKRGAQRDTLLIVSGCAPRRQVHCGEKLSGRNQRRGSAPGQIEFEGTAMAAALTLAEPGALRLPGLQKGSEKQKKELLRFVHPLGDEVEVLQLSPSDSFRMTTTCNLG